MLSQCLSFDPTAQGNLMHSFSGLVLSHVLEMEASNLPDLIIQPEHNKEQNQQKVELKSFIESG